MERPAFVKRCVGVGVAKEGWVGAAVEWEQQHGTRDRREGGRSGSNQQPAGSECGRGERGTKELAQHLRTHHST